MTKKMGRPKLPDTRKHRYSVRLTKDEETKVKDRMQKNGVKKVSEFIRKKILNGLGIFL